MKDIKDNPVALKSKAFALRIINAYKILSSERREFVLSKQLLRSGTSIGANIREAIRAQSKPDFYTKICVAIKEASESEYWIELLSESQYLSDAEGKSLLDDCQELIRMLMAISKSTKAK